MPANLEVMDIYYWWAGLLIVLMITLISWLIKMNSEDEKNSRRITVKTSAGTKQRP
jgi:hypothetical protein